MVQVALLNLSVVLFPWGWRAQLFVVAASLGGYAFAAPFMRSADAAPFCALILGVSAIVTVFSARFSDRYRRRAFRARAAAREQAEIAAALYQAATALAPVERTDDVLAGVTRIAVESLGCDWSCTFRWDRQGGAFRLAAETGLDPVAADEIGGLEVGTEFGAAVGRVRAGGHVEVPDTSVTDALPPGLMARWRMASLLAMPMRRGNDVVGVIVTGYRARRAAFPPRHHRLQEGLAQIAVKMFFKEDFVPATGDRFLHTIAPFAALSFALMSFAAIPFGDTVTVAGHQTELLIFPLNVGLLFVFAMMSMGIYGVFLAGFSSNNKYSFIGGLRASSQMLSYEITMGATLVGLLMIFGTLDLNQLNRAQGGLLWGWLPKWGIILQPVGFILFLAAGMAETKRIPFDLPEGESEIIGYFLEYSSMKFGAFFMTDFIETILIAALISTLFFGGWQVPYLQSDGSQGR